MKDFYPYFTNDGSVGLYSSKDEDIYHSTNGALSEAYEKFVLPADISYYLNRKSQINLLDVCYGIGYNTKSFINYLLEIKKNKKYLKNKSIVKTSYIDTIDTNNKKCQSEITNCIASVDDDNMSEVFAVGGCISSIDADNLFCKNNDKTFSKYSVRKFFIKNFRVFEKSYLKIMLKKQIINKEHNILIKALELDKDLVYLSPFFKTEGGSQDKELYFKNNMIEKILNNYDNKISANYVMSRKVKDFIICKLLEYDINYFEDKDLINNLANNELHEYYDEKLLNFEQLMNFSRSNSSAEDKINPFLHNIYYEYLSKRYKKGQKLHKNLTIDLEFEINDARMAVLNDMNKYDIIFLDAFTPSKCPMLWTLDFLKLLYERLDDDGILITYSKSIVIKSTLIQAGFEIANIKNKLNDDFIGTVATKNKNIIECNDNFIRLDEKDIGLIGTRAGICYNDNDFKLSNDDIIKNRELDYNSSNLIKATRYLKDREEKECNMM